jgi:hypothetical protein
MANPVIPNLDGTNPGPAGISTINLQSPFSTLQRIETLAVSLTPLIVATITTAEQSFGLNGVSQVTAATGIKAGDVILAVSSPGLQAGVALCNYRVDAAVNDKFYLTFVNPTAAGVVPLTGNYVITVARYNLSNSAAPLPSSMVAQ